MKSKVALLDRVRSGFGVEILRGASRGKIVISTQQLKEYKGRLIAVEGLDRQILRLNLQDPSELDITGIPEFHTGVTSELQSK